MRGILLFIESDSTGPINLGNPEEHTIIELAQQIIDIVKSESKIVFKGMPADDPQRRRPDISQAEKLGWSPTIELRDGLGRAVEYFQELI